MLFSKKENILIPMSKNIALACFSILLGLLIVEALLHIIVPLGYIRGQVVGTYATNDLPRHEVRPFGSMFKPHATGTSEYYCYQTPVRTNEFGFHDNTWPTDLAGGIALIGDSFMRSEQVPISSSTAAFMRAELGVPVINVGNNTLGTLGELELYRTYIKKLHPSVVILFFFPGNDITDNNCANNTQSRCATINPAGSLELQDNGIQIPQSIFLQFTKKYCFSCNVVLNKFNSFKKSNSIENTNDSWRITELALIEFQKELKKDGSTFVVVIVPSGDVSKKYPTQDEKKALMLIQKLGINALELRPEFSAYIERANVQSPFLSFWCDSHWNPVGHYVAAQHITSYLRNSEILSPLNIAHDQQQKKFPSPALLLGEEAFGAIYNRGVYSPRSSE